MTTAATTKTAHDYALDTRDNMWRVLREQVNYLRKGIEEAQNVDVNGEMKETIHNMERELAAIELLHSFTHHTCVDKASPLYEFIKDYCSEGIKEWSVLMYQYERITDK